MSLDTLKKLSQVYSRASESYLLDLLKNAIDDTEREKLDKYTKEVWLNKALPKTSDAALMGALVYLSARNASEHIRALALLYLLRVYDLNFDVLNEAKNSADNADKG